MGWDAGMLHGETLPAPRRSLQIATIAAPVPAPRTRMIFGMVAPNHVFLEIEFFLLVAFSFVLPVAIYGFLLKRASISRYAVIALTIVLIAIAGIDLYLLQFLADAAKRTPSAVDDWLFLSQFSIALYLIPAVFAGLGVNLLSHILIDHLHRAESRYDRASRER